MLELVSSLNSKSEVTVEDRKAIYEGNAGRLLKMP
jgi:hypothetical protein